MCKVTIVENVLEPSTWQTSETSDVCQFIYDHFQGKWPEGAHIYLDRVESRSDITPFDSAGVERLAKVKGDIFVVVYPEGLPLILVIVALAVSAVAIGLAFLLRPSPNTKTNQQQSPNNSLSNRSNQARPNERIPDIFGQLWATFDLLAVPYRIFVNQFEYEHSFMCVGRGTYDFATVNGVLQIRDDTTPVANIDGAQVQVYGPGKNPNLGSIPDIIIGAAFTENVVNVAPFGAVNGQLLQAPNLGRWPGGFRFKSPNILEDTIGISWLLGVNPGDTIYVGGYSAGDSLAVDSAGIQPTVNLGGVYIAASVSATQIALVSPATINANWSALAAFGGGVSTSGTSNLQFNNPFWAGGNTALPVPLPPFWLDHPELTQVWCNFVALQGSYTIDSSSGSQAAVNTTIQVGITPCDASGVASGGESLYTVTLIGSDTNKQSRGVTLKATVTPGAGGVLVRAHRTSSTNDGAGFQTSDEVQWRDCYAVSDVGAIDFGNITTVQMIQKATPNATAIKDRKLNGLVTRKIFTQASPAVLVDSINAADIIYHMALDPKIGNLTAADLDLTNLLAVAGAGGEIQNYFSAFPDITIPTQFCYTFDDSKVSFEESVNDIATAIFCVAYRRSGLLALSFERQTPNSTLLFNHRNKLPQSESRTVSFGTVTENDGIALDYIEPNAPNAPNIDTPVTIYIPVTATNPRKVKTIGVRNVQQATLLAWRMYWKLVGQNTAVDFDSTEEAALLVLQDRILVADNTRSDTQDGEVISQSVLLLTLSQNVVFDMRFNYTMYLQHLDETVEAIGISAGPNTNQVVLAFAPAFACVTDDAKFARTTYMIVNDSPTRSNAFLITEKTPKSGKIWNVKAINYDDLYYQKDGLYSDKMDVGGLYLEVMTPGPGANADVAGLFIEVMYH